MDPRTRPLYVSPARRAQRGAAAKQEALFTDELTASAGHLRMPMPPSWARGQMPLSPLDGNMPRVSRPGAKYREQYATDVVTELQDEGEEEQSLFLGIFPHSDKDNLEYCVYMAACTAGVFMLLLLIESAANAYFQHCDLPIECFNLDIELERSRSVEVDPCDNMFAHVCGQWTSMYPDQPDQFEVLTSRLLMMLFKNIDRASTNSDSAADKVGAALYACVRVGEDGVDHTSTIRDILDRHGLRFPVERSRSTRDVFRILVALTLRDLLGVFFQLKLMPYLKTDNRFGFEFKYAETMHRYVTDVEFMAACLHAYDPAFEDVPKFAKMLFEVEMDVRAIREIHSTDEAVPHYSKFQNIEAIFSKHAGLDAIVKAHWWVDDINENIPMDSAISVDTEILIKDDQVLLLLEDSLRAYRTRSVQLQNYIAWKVIKYLSYAASSRMFYCHNPFGRPHWAYTFANAIKRCTQYIKLVMPYGLLQLQLKDVLDDEAIDYARNVAYRIRHQLELSYNSSWLDPISAEGIVKRLRSIHQIIGTASKFRSESEVDSYYRHVPHYSPELNFVDWLVVALRSVVSHKKTFLRPSAGNLVTVSKDDWEIVGISVGAYYVIIYHIIFLPGTILMPPFMVPEGPNTYNYGAIGKVIGHELAHAFDPDFLDVSPRGEKHVFYSRHFSRMLERQRECLIIQANKMTRSAIAGNNSISETFSDNAGVEAAYLAYSALQKPDRQIGAGPYSADQAFFAGGCYMFCQAKEEFSEHNIYLPNHVRCNQPCINTQEFADAFGCKMGSPMFPSHRCDIHDKKHIKPQTTR